MRTLFRAVLVVLALSVCVAVAQEKAPPKGKPAAKAAQKQAPAGMQSMMVAPSPEMKKLTTMLSGTWKVEEKHEAMDQMPAGTSTGTSVFRSGPGRLSLIQDYKSTMGGMGSFSGLGLVWWDPADKLYKGFWCDSMSPSGCAPIGTGKWEGNDLVFNGEMDMNGQKHTMKSTYTNIKPDSVTFNMEMDGKPAMTMTFTKLAKKQ